MTAFKPKIILLACASAIIFLAATGSARVFWRRTATGTKLFDEVLGWQTVYQAPMRVNNQPGTLWVVRSEATIAASAASLATVCNADNIQLRLSSSHNLRLGLAHAADRVWRLLLLDLGKADGTIMFLLEQSVADYQRSKKIILNKLPPDIPYFTGSRPCLLLENDDTRTTFCLSTVNAAPATVLDFFEQSLAADGFSHLLPDNAFKPDIMIYTRHNILFCVMAHRAGGDETTVMVLRKGLHADAL